MDLSIIIVSYNTRADLVNCLDSVRNHPPAAAHEVIVVDNASTDGSPDTAEGYSGVRVIRRATNGGFAAANNDGLRVATGEFVLLLNSDTVVPPRTLDRMLARLRRSPEIAVLGPRLVEPHPVRSCPLVPCCLPSASGDNGGSSGGLPPTTSMSWPRSKR
jgi:GT2 family glycosyltransferase